MRIEIREWSGLPPVERERILRRSGREVARVSEAVAAIVRAVAAEGDAAIKRYSARFDGVELERIEVSADDLHRTARRVPSELAAALDYAIANVRGFHQTQLGPDPTPVTVRRGLVVRERRHPIDRVGIYVPSGRGSFPSMLYMLSVPAKIAGVEELCLATPPDRSGGIDPAVAYAALATGVDRVFAIGGAQAIAALAYGSRSVPRVRKIVGPGSAVVAAAKRVVADVVDTGPATGPSESIVLAAHGSDPRLVALDLMVEAEHGADSAALLVTDAPELAQRVAEALADRIPNVAEPRRGFLAHVFDGYGGILRFTTLDAAIDFVNEYAPEHLMIHAAEPRAIAERIRTAAEVLIGPHTTFSLANYAAGANAVLPTGGWAHSQSPISVHDFLRRSTVVEVDHQAMTALAPHVVRLADYEGFPSHAAALRER